MVTLINEADSLSGSFQKLLFLLFFCVVKFINIYPYNIEVLAKLRNVCLRINRVNEVSSNQVL